MDQPQTHWDIITCKKFAHGFALFESQQGLCSVPLF